LSTAFADANGLTLPFEVTGRSGGVSTHAIGIEAFSRMGDFAGTGSDLANVLKMLGANLRARSGSSVRVHVSDVDYLDASKPVSEAVDTIRKSFALSVTDLAAVLAVERPTIYSWLRDQAAPSRARAERLGNVLRYADLWTTNAASSSAAMMKAKTPLGRTLLEAFKEAVLPDEEITACLMGQARLSSRSKTDVLMDSVRASAIPQRSDADFAQATNRPLGPEL
jgi:DNA-binding transcriptional regulator YiaG